MPAPRTKLLQWSILEWFKADGREVYRPGLAAKKEPTRTHPCAEVPVILRLHILLDRGLVKRVDGPTRSPTPGAYWRSPRQPSELTRM